MEGPYYKEILRKNHCFLKHSFLSDTTLFFTIVELLYQSGIIPLSFYVDMMNHNCSISDRVTDFLLYITRNGENSYKHFIHLLKVKGQIEIDNSSYNSQNKEMDTS